MKHNGNTSGCNVFLYIIARNLNYREVEDAGNC